MKLSSLSFMLAFLFHSSYCIVQEAKVTDSVSYHSISKMDAEQIRHLVDNGFDLNQTFNNNHDWTYFNNIMGKYGFHCDSTLIDIVYVILKQHKYPLSDPFIFLEDPCNGFVTNHHVLELFKLAKVNNPDEIGESTFRRILNAYYIGKYSASLGNNYKNVARKTALMYAIENGYVNIVNYLIEHDIDLEIKDSLGRTALIYAIQNNQLEITEVLIQNGSNVLARCNANKSVLDYACENKDKELLRLITKQRKIRRSVGGRKKLKTYCENT